jgi:membrane-associated phospholipid phosphatase
MARRTAWVPVLAVAVFVILTVQVVQHDGIVHADLQIRSWVAAHQIRTVRNTANLLTDIVSPPIEIVVLLIYFWRRRRPQFRAAAIAILGTQAVVIVIKAAVGRPTPIHASRFYGDYPSGHTAMLLTCAGTVLILSRVTGPRARRLWAATAIATVVMMTALIYAQGHWLSDTIASVALATVSLWLLAVTTTDR